MFPVPIGPANAASLAYGAAKQAQDVKLHEQNHPEEAQAKEHRQQESDKEPGDFEGQDTEGMAEIRKASQSALSQS